MDVTRILYNKEDGNKADREPFIWAVRSAACEGLHATFSIIPETGTEKLRILYDGLSCIPSH